MCFAGNEIRRLGREGRIILASAADEKSWFWYNLWRGVFSYYLIQGLYGKADGYPTPEGSLKDGWVSAEEAFYYAAPLTTKYRGDQHPQIYDGIEGQVPLGKCKYKLKLEDEFCLFADLLANYVYSNNNMV